MSVLWMIQRNFENKIWFYKIELLETLRNPEHRPDLVKSVHMSLKKAGDLRVERHKHTTFYHLSPRIVAILNDLELSKMTNKSPSRAYVNSPGGQPVPVHESELISKMEEQK